MATRKDVGDSSRSGAGRKRDPARERRCAGLAPIAGVSRDWKVATAAACGCHQQRKRLTCRTRDWKLLCLNIIGSTFVASSAGS